MTDLPISFWALFDLAVLVYWVGASILIISQDREPTATLAWLLVLFAIPFFGLVVYFLFSINMYLATVALGVFAIWSTGSTISTSAVTSSVPECETWLRFERSYTSTV